MSESVEIPIVACTSTLQIGKDTTYACGLPVGHKESHRGSGMWWTGPGNGSTTESVEIPDAAVEAAAKAACEAAYPPNPSGRVKIHDSWEEIEEWERDAWRATARAALVAARPYLMPTREQIVTVIGDALWFEERPERTGAEINNVAADAVLALLNGAES